MNRNSLSCNLSRRRGGFLPPKTGRPILPFTITPRRYWEAKSWDRFQVPLPFTMARVEIAPPIYVSADADDEVLAARRDDLQESLDKINRNGEQWWMTERIS